MIEITRDTASFDRIDVVLRTLGASVPTAGSRALNRAALAGRTVMVKGIAQDLGVKQAALKSIIFTKAATQTKLESKIVCAPKASRRGIALRDLNPSGPEPSRGKGGGVRVQADPRQYPHAFLATMPKSGHRGVFARKTTKRLPIQELFTRPLKPIFVAHRAATIARAVEALYTNLVSELRYALRAA